MFRTVSKEELGICKREDDVKSESEGKIRSDIDCNYKKENRFMNKELITDIIKKCEILSKKLKKLQEYEENKDFENLFKNSRRVVTESENITQLIRTIPINYGDKDGYRNLKEDLAGNNTMNVRMKI